MKFVFSFFRAYSCFEELRGQKFLTLTHQHQILKLARKLADENAGVLLILHDLNLTAQYADKILLLKDGKTAAFGTPSEVLTEEIIETVFRVKVSVIKHPFFDCPLVIWKEDSILQ